ncbi:P-loop NTPase fold protein [Shewanella algae]|uniref:P-loop NTPase fold protein n=1 Tax=Shewanella algae TaxID=38313 RepID=UPI0031F4C542
MSSNTHIEEYLKYYCEMKHAPEYAVLLKGKWGAGKTWFIKRYQENNSDCKFLYISLYGLTSFSEIEDEFFKQLHPVLASKGMALTTKVLKGVLKIAIKVDLDNDGKSDTTLSSQVPDINLPDYLKNAGERVLIFDDLERCTIETESILGYINHFVEHQDMKCILIANEEEIFQKDEAYGSKETQYKRVKEKLIGKTLEISSDPEEAISGFISTISNDDYRLHLERNINNIIDVYKLADYKNLRHMKHAVWDFERIIEKIPSEASENSEFISHLIIILFAYSFEVKSGNVLANEIGSIEDSFYSALMDDDKKEDKFKKIRSKYNNFDVTDSLLGSLFWEQFFGAGIIPIEEIESSIQSSRYFQSQHQPKWIKLWHCFDHEDDDLQSLLSDVEIEFFAKQHTDIGVIKHIVSIFLWLSDIGIYAKSKPEIISSSQTLMSQMLEENLIPYDEANKYELLERDAYAGLGYYGRDLSEFSDFCSFIENALDVHQKSQLPVASADLLQIMKDDVTQFWRMVSHSNNAEGSFYKLPVLQHISVADFIEAYFSIAPLNRRKVFLALNARYEHSYYNKYLVEEIDWLKQLLAALQAEASSRTGQMSGYVLDAAIDKYIPGAITRLESVNQESGS